MTLSLKIQCLLTTIPKNKKNKDNSRSWSELPFLNFVDRNNARYVFKGLYQTTEHGSSHGTWTAQLANDISSFIIQEIHQAKHFDAFENDTRQSLKNTKYKEQNKKTN